MSESESLAIIGISCLFPKADDLQQYWKNIKHGVDAITPIPASHWNASDFFNSDPKAPDRTYAQRGGFISPVDFNPMEFGIAPKDVEATDTTQLLGMVVAKQALVDAGYGEKAFNKDRTSVILGVTGALELVIPLGARLGHPIWRKALKEAGVAEPLAEDVVQRISDSYVGWQENSFPGLLGNVVAGRIASRLDLGGTNCVVDAACASSMAALHLAAMELSSGRADMVITGGLDTFNDIFMYMCFSKTPALSPSGDAKPFDRSCDGTILGEGLGMVVLKRLADAERDGDKIYAVIKGIGSSSDGRGNAIYAPRADGQKEALIRAYENAGVTPDTVDLVEAHGTGTKVGDATEVSALTEVYRSHKKDGTWAALGSVKSQIGHTKAAAGVAGLIKAALALDHKVLPPTIKVSKPLDELAGASPFYVNTQKRPWLPRNEQPRRAGISAFGFGGTNFHCVLEEHGNRMKAPGWDGDVEIVALSAESREELKRKAAGLPANAAWPELRTKARTSRNEFSSKAEFRLLLPVSQGTELGPVRDAAVKMLTDHPDKKNWSLPNGAAFGSGKVRGKLGALFPGQGSQYVGMFRDLACQFPEMIEALSAADRVFASEHPEGKTQRLSDFIYPHPAFNDETRTAQSAALKSTDVAQPALGAIGLGAMNVLNYFGIKPEAAAGHSYGELLALCGAGRLDPESLHFLSNVRGQLMANRNGHSDRGSMIAVQASEEVVTAFINNGGKGLVIANRNSPSQFVLAGEKKQIQHAADEFAKRSVRAQVLQVSAAFHSPLVADACEPFAGVLEKVDFGKGHLPVYANTTAKIYPTGAKQARSLLANQIVNPVDFTAQIQTMHADGVSTFVEMGPGHVLSDLVQAILPGKDIEAVALDSSRGKRSGTFDLAVTLCRISALGHEVDLSRWEKFSETPKAPTGKLTIPLTGANYRAPRKTPPRPPLALPAAAAPAPILNKSSSSISAPAPVLNSDLAASLRAAQEGILSLQKLQEQTAQLHRQFLENQDAARRTLEALLAQRRGVLNLPAIDLPKMPAYVPLQIPQEKISQVKASTVKPAEKIVRAPETPKVGPLLSVAPVVLEVVAEKTGYPVEMLNLDMGLDSDLGIDSIKRVEIMAALHGKLPEAPEIKPEHLGTLQTLRQVVEFLSVENAEAAGGGEAAIKNHVAATGDSRCPQAGAVAPVVLEVVAEKTGYPVEMLNLDMGLDSDLGIDSIKRVEIMAALHGKLPEAPEIKPEHLGTLQTLRQVVEFLSAGNGEAAGGEEAVVTNHVAATGDSRTPEAGAVAPVVLEVVAEKTGYPVEMLNLDMGLDSDLGIDSIKRVEIMAALHGKLPEAPEIKPEHLGTLQTLRQVVEFLTGSTEVKKAATVVQPSSPMAEVNPTVAPDEVHRQLIQPVALGAEDARTTVTLPANARIWVTEDGSKLAPAVEARLKKLGYSVRRAIPAEFLMDAKNESPAALVILWPSVRCEDATLKESFRLIQAAGKSLRQAKGILVTVSRLDGVFGFGSLNGAGDPTSGGLAGLAKTARHEWPEVHCKAIDLNPEVPIGAEMAGPIVDEMFRVGPVEVGLFDKKRFGLQVETVPLSSNGHKPLFNDGDVMVVTGGARGITGTTALELARKNRLQLVLLGRSQLTEQEPSWLAGLKSNEEIKKTIVARANGQGTPKQIEATYRETLAQREIRDCLKQIRSTGATAAYRSVDVRDTAAVKTALAEIRKEFGPIRGLVHGAGVLADKRIEDKTEEQFDLVYSTKVSGLKNLLGAAQKDDLKLLALFSSYTGRFGRTGQVDYAAANEVMNKMAQSESRRRPKCKVVSFNWGPWNGGMVSDGLRKIFADEGVSLIEPQAGAEFFVREIATHTPGPVEILVLAKTAGARNRHAVVEKAEASVDYHVAFEREVSAATMPCLKSHVINGRAVLPAALMIEWLGHAAMHGNPGMMFHGLENFRVLKGVTLENGASVTVSVLAGENRMKEGLVRVPVQMRSQSNGKSVLHAQAEIVLTENLPAAPSNGKAKGPADERQENVYGNGRLFHGVDFQGLETVEFYGENAALATVKNSPAPKQWVSNPLRPAWLTDPLALDGSFQMMILWCWKHRGAASLPCALKHYRQYSAFPKNGTQISIEIESADSAVVTATLHFSDAKGRLVAVAEGYECVIDNNLQAAFQRTVMA